MVLLKYWTSDSELAGVLLRRVRRATFVSAIPYIGFACLSKSILMIFIPPVDAHSLGSGMLDYPSMAMVTADYIGHAWYCSTSFVVHEFCDK